MNLINLFFLNVRSRVRGHLVKIFSNVLKISWVFIQLLGY